MHIAKVGQVVAGGNGRLIQQYQRRVRDLRSADSSSAAVSSPSLLCRTPVREQDTLGLAMRPEGDRFGRRALPPEPREDPGEPLPDLRQRVHVDHYRIGHGVTVLKLVQVASPSRHRATSESGEKPVGGVTY